MKYRPISNEQAVPVYQPFVLISYPFRWQQTVEAKCLQQLHPQSKIDCVAPMPLPITMRETKQTETIPKVALFVYSEEAAELVIPLKENPYGVTITAVTHEAFFAKPAQHLPAIKHVVVSGPIKTIKRVMELALEFQFSIGIVPTKKQKKICASFDLPQEVEQAIKTALTNADTAIDLIRCNGKILLFRGTIGSIPLLDAPSNKNKPRTALEALKRIRRLKHKGFTFTTGSNRPVKTAACGCMIIQQQEKTLAAKLIEQNNSCTDGMISLIIAAPLSVVSYIKFITESLRQDFSLNNLTSTIGYLKTETLRIESTEPVPMFIDGEEATSTPVQCEVLSAAVRVKTGEKLHQQKLEGATPAEITKINNLPQGKEIIKAQKKQIPFFSYASEERFRDLFLALKGDAAIDPIYIILMLLSTLLATVGLYLNSSSVVIGAMLLAPLMSPIVSLAMGLLRGDSALAFRSFRKIIVGVGIALSAAALMSLTFPYKPVTAEMQARLNPSLLDLAVAVIAGIAGAYTKSYKEILQSLAGVGIAVALVPPLAVAGIGLGRLDLLFAWQAFLLFSTNLIGITLAAAYTFRVLGFSAAVRNKRGVALIAITMALIAIPLFLSYKQIVSKAELEKSWQTERFLVNGKYLIVREANLTNLKDKKVLYVNLLARDQLNRHDLAQFKRKIQGNFDKKLIVRANITYIP
ncbi:TIGR00341 family protein [Desulfogranum marinum]|uniref:TIGR00341 family protein n=1 Tax=Desulfogranum marinum TaxID=453220 RepID=UPI00196330EE|nr:TIGR00341 family protein [Desulfogranum marinum]MBM9512515.1 TIGR00341 family protein [Desulfogranum marinum]